MHREPPEEHKQPWFAGLSGFCLILNLPLYYDEYIFIETSLSHPECLNQLETLARYTTAGRVICERWFQTLLRFPHSTQQIKSYFLYLKILITYGECTCSSGITVISTAIWSLGCLFFGLWCFWEQDKMNICFFIQLLPFCWVFLIHSL